MEKIIEQPLSPTTTFQEDLTVAGQRRINLIWEYTQAVIAIVVVSTNMIAALYNVFNNKNIDVPLIMSSALFLIVGAYFQRTNHQLIGGIGPKATDNKKYEGR